MVVPDFRVRTTLSPADRGAVRAEAAIESPASTHGHEALLDDLRVHDACRFGCVVTLAPATGRAVQAKSARKEWTGTQCTEPLISWRRALAKPSARSRIDVDPPANCSAIPAEPTSMILPSCNSNELFVFRGL